MAHLSQLPPSVMVHSSPSQRATSGRTVRERESPQIVEFEFVEILTVRGVSQKSDSLQCSSTLSLERLVNRSVITSIAIPSVSERPHPQGHRWDREERRNDRMTDAAQDSGKEKGRTNELQISRPTIFQASIVHEVEGG